MGLGWFLLWFLWWCSSILYPGWSCECFSLPSSSCVLFWARLVFAFNLFIWDALVLSWFKLKHSAVTVMILCNLLPPWGHGVGDIAVFSRCEDVVACHWLAVTMLVSHGEPLFIFYVSENKEVRGLLGWIFLILFFFVWVYICMCVCDCIHILYTYIEFFVLL